MAAEPEAVDEIITRCARLPLALTILAARAATHPQFPLATLAGELRDTRVRLDVFDDGDPATDVRTVFSWSYQRLSTQAARLFRHLGLHPGPDLATPAAASLAGLPNAQVRPLLAELTRAHLLTEHTRGRYAFHDLLRTYATELTHTHDPDADQHAAQHRMLDHYLHTAHTAMLLMEPRRDPPTLAPAQPGAAPESLADLGQALGWFTAEHPVLLAAIRHAAAAGFDTHICQLAWTLASFLAELGHWDDWAAIQETAMAAAQRLADRPAQAHFHRTLALVHVRLGRHDDAHTHLRHALDLYGELADRTGLAFTHLNIATALGLQGRHREAIGHAQQSLNLHRATGDRSGQAAALNTVGWYHALLGDYQQTLTCCQQALALSQDTDFRHGEAASSDSLGYAHHHLGHHAQAIICYQHALDMYRKTGYRSGEAGTLIHLGDTHDATGHTTAARTAWQHALHVLTDLGHPDADTVRAKLHDLDQPQTSATTTPQDT